jgi:molybdopterin-binding protein
MKISARNQLKGKVTAVKLEQQRLASASTSAVVVMASITNEAVADLGIKVGDDVWAIIKASELMVGK